MARYFISVGEEMNTKKGDEIETPKTVAKNKEQAGRKNVFLYAFLKRMKIKEHPNATLLSRKLIKNEQLLA